MKYLLLFAIITASSCVSTQIISSWRTPENIPTQYEKVLVLSVPGGAKRAYFTKMEEHLAGDLSLNGFQALTSTFEYGDNAFLGMNEQSAIAKLSEKSFDAVVTIVLLDKRNEKYFVPGRYKNYGPSPDGWWDHFNKQVEEIQRVGYYESTTKYFWQTNVYDLKTKKLVFSCNTESFDPVGAAALGHEYGKLISDEISKNGITPNKNRKPF